MTEEYITANVIVNKLKIKNPSIRRKVYKYIKEIMYELRPNEYEDLLFKDKSKKRYVMKIPKSDVPVLLQKLEKYRVVRKTEMKYVNGELKKEEIVEYLW